MYRQSIVEAKTVRLQLHYYLDDMDATVSRLNVGAVQARFKNMWSVISFFFHEDLSRVGACVCARALGV